MSGRSLRYYEEQGLLTSTRTPAGQRTYTESEVDRVVLIQRMYAAGLSSRTIAEVMPCVDLPSEDHSDSAFERLILERDRISKHIDDLITTRESLDALIKTNRDHRATLTRL